MMDRETIEALDEAIRIGDLIYRSCDEEGSPTELLVKELMPVLCGLRNRARQARAGGAEAAAKVADEVYEMNKPDEFAADIARRIRALPLPASPWRPIEEAPKDGTEVLGGYYWERHWMRVIVRWLDSIPGWWGFGGGHSPSHFMPLPPGSGAAPPADEDALSRLWTDQAEWSQRTFGTDAERGPVGPLKHLEKEAAEAAANPTDRSEYADCFLLILDAARRSGMTLPGLIEAAVVKHAVCRQRQWPKPTSSTEPVEHVRSAPPAVTDAFRAAADVEAETPITAGFVPDPIEDDPVAALSAVETCRLAYAVFFGPSGADPDALARGEGRVKQALEAVLDLGGEGDLAAVPGEAATAGKCRACGKPLLPENLCIADGCPCNSPRGVNHGLVRKDTCTCVECDPEQTGSVRKPATAGKTPQDAEAAALLRAVRDGTRHTVDPYAYTTGQKFEPGRHCRLDCLRCKIEAWLKKGPPQ